MKLRIGIPIFAFLVVMLFKIIPNNILLDFFYTEKFYRPVTKEIANVTSTIPINLSFTILLIILIIVILLAFTSLISIFKKNFKPILHLINFIMISVSIFIISFVVIWAPNYKARGISNQLKIENTKLSPTQVGDLAEYLLDEAKSLRNDGSHSLFNGSNKEAEEEIYSAYEAAGRKYDAFKEPLKVLKEFPFGEQMKYTGISGYYFPMTAEAVYNPIEHKLFRYSTMYHEMAHGYGFAKEEESSTLSYIVSRYGTNNEIKYACTVDTLLKVMAELKDKDIRKYNEILEKYGDGIKGDLQNYKDENEKYLGKIQSITEDINNEYLKLNGQKGILEYNNVSGFIYSYLKKENKL